MTPGAPVRNEPVAEIFPGLPGKQIHEVALDFDRVIIPGEPETPGESSDVGIHDHALVEAEGIPENYVGRLASDTGQLCEFFETAWDFAAVPLQQDLGAGADIAGLVSEKSGAVNEGFEFFL